MSPEVPASGTGERRDYEGRVAKMLGGGRQSGKMGEFKRTGERTKKLWLGVWMVACNSVGSHFVQVVGYEKYSREEKQLACQIGHGGDGTRVGSRSSSSSFSL